MKNYFLLLVLATTVLTGCTAQNTPSQENDGLITVTEEGYTTINETVLEETLSVSSSQDLSQKEIDGLLYMREEEKLAQDVYLFLAEKWNQQVFSNIAKSEGSHTSAIKSLLDKYNLEDPALTETGVFANSALQTLYNELTTEGSASLEQALLVGAKIEELDILDIQVYLEDVTHEDIKTVYNNLLRGSRNHLRAFVKNIERKDSSYTPQLLDTTTYNDIISTGTERGNHR